MATVPRSSLHTLRSSAAAHGASKCSWLVSAAASDVKVLLLLIVAAAGCVCQLLMLSAGFLGARLRAFEVAQVLPDAISLDLFTLCDELLHLGVIEFKE